MLHSFRYPAAVLAAAILALSACDQAPGLLDDAGAPPELSDFSFSPHQFIAPPGDGNANMVVPLSMEVTVRDPDHDVEAVSFVVFGNETIAEGVLALGSGGRYAGRSDVIVPTGEIGVYTVLVFAEDMKGMLSNQVRGMMHVSAEGSPPVISMVVAPDTLHRPGPGEPARLLELVAVVSDPDGLANIAAVEFWNAATPGTRIGMFDEGADGDAEAADGRYTRVVRIESSNEPGVTTLAFQARDRAGLLSDTVEATVVVE